MRAPGWQAFLRKEFREILHTWRLWVMPGILLFLGLSTPILTKLTPQIIKATANKTPGLVLHFPPPVARDAYLQFVGNLEQLVIIALVIVTSAAIASERRSGTAVLVLTKPLSRTGFVMAKALSQLVLLGAATLLGTLVCLGVTVAIFRSTADTGHLLAAVGAWFVFAAMMTLLTLFLSATLEGQAPAGGAGIAVWAAFLVVAAFPLIRDHSPAGLTTASDAILRGQHTALLWPVVSSLALAGLSLAGAVWTFARKEL